MDEQRTVFVCGHAPLIIAWLFAADDPREQRTIFLQRRCSSHAATEKANTFQSADFFSDLEELLFVRHREGEYYKQYLAE